MGIAEYPEALSMYFECSADGTTISFGEHCEDCDDLTTCGEYAEDVAADGSYCFIVPEEDNLVHTVECGDVDGTMTAFVNVWVCADDCNSDLTGTPTEVHPHESGLCEQLVHEHGGEDSDPGCDDVEDDSSDHVVSMVMATMLLVVSTLNAF